MAHLLSCIKAATAAMAIATLDEVVFAHKLRLERGF